MKLYLVKRIDHVGYDEFNGMVVAAVDEADALTIYPGDPTDPPGFRGWAWDEECGHMRWPRPIDHAATLEITYLGKTQHERGVVLASFRAG